RNNNDVILILAHGSGRALRGEHTNHFEWQVVDANRFTNRVRGAKQILSDRFADNGYVGGHFHVVLRERSTFLERPVSHLEVLRFCSVDLRCPVVVPEHNLRGRLASGSGSLHCGRFTQNCSHVVVDECFGCTVTHAHSAAGNRTRTDEKNVGTHRRDLLLRLLLSALAHTYHRNH